MGKPNCWEFKACGRQPGGTKAAELGVCPAAMDETSNGINGGSCAGRICWAVGGTFCGGKVQGSFAKKLLDCIACDFFQEVKTTEGSGKFRLLKPSQEAEFGDAEPSE